jgi:hypothetical protein
MTPSAIKSSRCVPQQTFRQTLHPYAYNRSPRDADQLSGEDECAARVNRSHPRFVPHHQTPWRPQLTAFLEDGAAVTRPKGRGQLLG